MQIDLQHFLITVCSPLQITLQVPIERESQAVLGMALQGQLELVRSKGFQPVPVYVDPQSALRALATKFENVAIDVGGAGDHLPKADAKIRCIKERYCSVKASLPWQLPISLVKDLVAFVVSRINMERSAAINLNVAPKVLFTRSQISRRSSPWHSETTVRYMTGRIIPQEREVCPALHSTREIMQQDRGRS